MYIGQLAKRTRCKFLRFYSFLFGLLMFSLLCSEPTHAICVATSMEGDWVNVEPEGVLKRIELRFRCCDQVRCPIGGPCVTVCNPDKDTVHVYGPCSSGTCDWGTVEPDYLFADVANGSQFTRFDAHFQVGEETRRLVILLLENDKILIHWSIDYPSSSAQKDFSLIEYFVHERCFTLMGHKVCLNWIKRKIDASDIYPRIIRQ